MNTSNEMDGLVGEHDVEVPRGAVPQIEAPREAQAGQVTPLGDCVRRGELFAERLPRGRYRIAKRFTVEVTLERHRRPGGPSIWIATATIEPGPERDAWAGPWQWTRIASELDVARRLMRSRGIVGFDLGQVFRDFGRTIEQGAQAIARSGVVQNVVRDIRRTLDSPGAQGVLQAVSFVPGLGQAVQGFRAATTLVDHVMNGDRRARANLAQVRHAARRGHPTAQQAVRVVNDVLAGQRRLAAARARARRPPAPPTPRARRPTAAEERAWREADARWNAWRAARARQGDEVSEPPLPTEPESDA